MSIPADVSKLSEVERLVQELEARENALHVLVNNAGTVWAQSLDEYPVGPFAGSILIQFDVRHRMKAFQKFSR